MKGKEKRTKEGRKVETGKSVINKINGKKVSHRKTYQGRREGRKEAGYK